MATGSRDRPHRVGLVVFDGVKMLDIAGPSEVFAESNRLGASYELVVCSVGGSSVTASTGMRIAADVDAAEPGLGFDTLLVTGGDRLPTHPIEPELRAAVRALAAHSRRVCSICTGAFILAAAGELDAHRATTHWQHTELLARAYPLVTVDPDAIFVRDGSLFTSAGVTAGIDLALALVEEDHGPDLTRGVARELVVYLQRPGGQSQFSAPLQGPAPRTPALRSIVDRVTADPSASHSLTELADHLNLSSRHLTRLFRDELSTTPARYVESIRFDIAKALLDQGHTATQAAERAGFPSYESLRRVFARELEMSPAVYQRRFRTARRSETPTAQVTPS